MRRLIVVTMLATVSLAAASAAAAGGGGHCSGQTGDAAGLEVRLDSSCFTPQVIRIRAGDTITFRNVDPYPHTVTGAGLEWGSNDLIAGGASVTATFDQPGVYPYMCNLHPGMVGAVVVGDAAPTGGEAAAAAGLESAGGSPPVVLIVSGAAIAGLVAAAIALLGARRRRVETG